MWRLLLYTLGKHYGTLRLNLQRSEGANCGHFILLCLTGRHCTLFTPCSVLKASWGFTTPFHSHRKGWKSFITLQECEPQAGSTSRPGALPGRAQSCPWALLELPQKRGEGEGNSCAPLPFPSLYPPAGAGQEGPAEPLWPKKHHQWKARRGTTMQAELCQLWPWGCRPLTSSASSSTDQKDPAAPPIQATKLDIWSLMVQVTPKNELDGISAFIVLRK